MFQQEETFTVVMSLFFEFSFMRVVDVLTVQRSNNIHTFYVKTVFLLGLI